MKLRTKISIDKYCGTPTVFILNAISLFFLHFKKEKNDNFSAIKRIVVCKFMGMGSIIQSSPLLLTLRINFPEAEIIFLTVPKNRELIKTFPFIDRTSIIDDRSITSLFTSTFITLFRFVINKPDIFIDMEIYSYFSTIINVLTFPKYKIGFYRKETRLQLGVYSKMIFFNTKAPVKYIYLQAAFLLKCKTIINELYDYKSLFEYKPQVILNRINELIDLTREIIVINPNSSDLRIERKWQPDKYVSLINAILDSYPENQIVLTGSGEEKNYVDSIFNAVREDHHFKVINTAGMLSFEELIFLIQKSCLMITNDSGPMHIAFALEKKTIALFGPCSPIEYSTQQNVHFIYKNIYCSPCVHHFSISPCNGNNQCMKLIATEEVFSIVEKALNNKTDWNSNHSDNGIIYNISGSDIPFGLVDRKTNLL